MITFRSAWSCRAAPPWSTTAESGTTAQAIAAGLPQLVVPTTHDQPDNAVRIRRLGIGDFILPKAYNKARVIEKLHRLMSPAVKGNCQRRAADLAGSQSLEKAADLIEELAATETGQPSSSVQNVISHK